MKNCFKCKKPKAISEFYKHPGMADGYLGKCKDCTKKDSRKNRSDNLLQRHRYDRERGNLSHRVKNRKKYAKTEEYRESHNKASRKWDKTNIEKKASHSIVGYAIKTGKLTKKPCHCGEVKVEAHHEDYAKPLQVVWLCSKHHRALHKKDD